MTGPPPPRHVEYAYFILDVTTTPPTVTGVELSRSACRSQIEFSPDADSLRIRRARCTLYES